MDVELGLQLAKCLDEFVSTSPLFISGETEVIFILTAILKGYTRELIKIDVNEYGRSIVISGEKPVQDMVTVGWKVYKKEVKMVGFTKAFMIPDGVILDQIEARFNKQNFKLTVSMPKMIKGAKGIRIKEVKKEEIGRGDYRSLPVDDDDEDIRKADQVSRDVSLVPEQAKEVPSVDKVEVLQVEDEKVQKGLEENVTTIQTFAEKNAAVQEYVQTPDMVSLIEREMMGKCLEESSYKHNIEEQEALKCDHNEKKQVVYETDGDGSDTREEKGFDKSFPKSEKKFRDQSTQTDPPRKPKKCCAPLIAGSALIVSLMVFVIHLIKDQDKPKKKK